MPADHAVLAVDRYAGEIAHVLVRTRELIEQRGFPAVLIAHKRESQQRSFRQRIARSLRVEFAFLAQAGVVGCFSFLSPLFRHSLLFDRADPDLFRIRKTERQLVAVDSQFHRIAHRGEFDHRHFRARNNAHIQEVLAKRPFASHTLDKSGLARSQFVESHNIFSGFLFFLFRCGGNAAEFRVDHAVLSPRGEHQTYTLHRHPRLRNGDGIKSGIVSVSRLADQRDMRPEAFPVEGNRRLRKRTAQLTRERLEIPVNVAEHRNQRHRDSSPRGRRHRARPGRRSF